MTIGDRAFLLRQSHERGIVASGNFVSAIEAGAHWDESRREINFARLEWDTVVASTDRLPLETIKKSTPDVRWDRFQGSGIRLADDAAEKLEGLWRDHVDRVVVRSPEEPIGESFPEGSVTRVEVNRYERDRRARAACLAHWGSRCIVCGLAFEERYGSIGAGFIHVHHLRELSTVGDGYHVDPINDLRPVCPNCHAMLHQERPALTIKELQDRMAIHS